MQTNKHHCEKISRSAHEQARLIKIIQGIIIHSQRGQQRTTDKAACVSEDNKGRTHQKD